MGGLSTHMSNNGVPMERVLMQDWGPLARLGHTLVF